MAYDNTNKGVLFKNDRKDSPNHPDYKGTVNVEGTEYWVSGWIKIAGNSSRNPGSKFLSVALTPKDERAIHQRASASPNLDDDDDIPF